MLKFAVGMIGGAVAYQMWSKAAPAPAAAATGEEAAQLEQEAEIANEEAAVNLAVAEEELMQGNFMGAYHHGMRGTMAARRAQVVAERLAKPGSSAEAAIAMARWQKAVERARRHGHFHADPGVI